MIRVEAGGKDLGASSWTPWKRGFIYNVKFLQRCSRYVCKQDAELGENPSDAEATSGIPVGE